MINAVGLLRQFIQQLFDVGKRRQPLGLTVSIRLYRTALAWTLLVVLANIQFLRPMTKGSPQGTYFW